MKRFWFCPTYNWTNKALTFEQSLKHHTCYKMGAMRPWIIRSSACMMWWPGETYMLSCLWHLWSPCSWKSKSSIRKRKHQFSSNSWQIDFSSAALSVLWIKEELDAVDDRWYPWLYSDWLQKESITRTRETVDLCLSVPKSWIFYIT